MAAKVLDFPTMPTTRKNALETALAEVRKKFGRGALQCLGPEVDGPREPVPVIPTGSIALDRATGCGGYPRGRVVEVYGMESSGKTTLALHAVAEVQRSGGIAAFVDVEHALDTKYTTALGVSVPDLLISQPDTGEQALGIVEHLVCSGAVDLIVIDSVAALVPKAELDGEMGDAHMGLHARLMSQALRKLTGLSHRNNVTLLFINQIRMKIGVLFGNPETTTGGNALKFYASLRLHVGRRQAIKNGEEVVGSHTVVKVLKNKMAPPFREAEFEVRFGQGIDRYGDALNVGLELGLIEKSGNWWSFGDARLGQGRDAAREVLSSNPELFAQLLAALRAK